MWAAALWVGALLGFQLHAVKSLVMVTPPVAASEAPALGSSSFLAVCPGASGHTPTWIYTGVSEPSSP